MAKYTPRLTEPSTTNKNFIHTSSGGYNRCIVISNGSCLPNCVGYSWGRWREILGKNHNLSLNNAENWWGNTADGYKRGQTPKVGAVICWRKGQAGNGADGAGHVAIVEQVKSNGDIVTSESHYGGARWRSKTYKAPNYYLGSSYTFQGFIYLPIEFDGEESNTTTSTVKPVASYKAGTYRVTCDLLNVRAGASTSFAKKTFSQLTANAQKQVKELNNGKAANGYVKGVECTVSEIKNGNWGKTPSGWICLDYCKKI